jgi:hypothetical protein
MFNRFKSKFKLKSPSRKAVDVSTFAIMLVALLALMALVYYNIVPIRTADIKVPVATDKSSYYHGQQIGGIFFGEIYYKGEVRILREVFCKNYRGIIKPPAESAIGDLFSTQSLPHKLEGNSVNIGSLPKDVPIGLNCVLQFTNIYVINTPFGDRTETYQYYTQNFAIITKERREQLDCEAAGGTTEQCQQKGSVGDADRDEKPSDSDKPEQQMLQSSPDRPESAPSSTTNNTTTNNTVNNPPATPTEPAPQPVRVCTVDALGIRLFCRTEYR